jgi:hypothetical protein
MPYGTSKRAVSCKQTLNPMKELRGKMFKKRINQKYAWYQYTYIDPISEKSMLFVNV